MAGPLFHDGTPGVAGETADEAATARTGRAGSCTVPLSGPYSGRLGPISLEATCGDSSRRHSRLPFAVLDVVQVTLIATITVRPSC
jgi:hypothetical protein